MHTEFKPAEITKALAYINGYWKQLERFHPRDEGTLVGLPRPYVVPSRGSGEGFDFEELYYWDSFFMAQAFIGTSRHRLAFDMTEDLLYLMRRFKIIPNGGRTYLTSRSQPPLLTTMIWQLYSVSGNKKWLLQAMDVAKDEYRTVWMGTQQPNWRQVFNGLSRYYDANMLHSLAEAESGWDMNPRFEGECLDYIPIDLNSLLYRYEKDFEASARLNKDYAEAAEWAHRASNRAQMIEKFLWNEDKGCFFDYNYVTRQQSPVLSLATFYPLWVGLATQEQARRVVESLDQFEFDGGVATTAKQVLKARNIPEQWKYPNGWAPLQLIVVESLERYGYHQAARRIARKWLGTNLAKFAETGEFYEKYNVVALDQAVTEGVYPSQTGFGWTNAIFAQFCERYLDTSERLAPMPVKASPAPVILLRRLGLTPSLLRHYVAIKPPDVKRT